MPQIGVAHAWVSANFGRRPCRNDRALSEYHDSAGKPKHKIHIVLNDQNREIPGQPIQGVQ